MGMTFVITLAGIDLSVGSIVALAGMATADILVHGWGVVAAIVGGAYLVVAARHVPISLPPTGLSA